MKLKNKKLYFNLKLTKRQLSLRKKDKTQSKKLPDLILLQLNKKRNSKIKLNALNHKSKAIQIDLILRLKLKDFKLNLFKNKKNQKQKKIDTKKL